MQNFMRLVPFSRAPLGHVSAPGVAIRRYTVYQLSLLYVFKIEDRYAGLCISMFMPHFAVITRMIG